MTKPETRKEFVIRVWGFFRHSGFVIVPAAGFAMIQLSEIRAVTFDVGGTLIAPWPSVGAVYAGAAARHGAKNLSPEILTRQFDEIWRAKKNFDHSREAWKKLVTATFA